MRTRHVEWLLVPVLSLGIGCGDSGTGGSGGTAAVCQAGYGGFPAADCDNLPDLSAYAVGNYYTVPDTATDDCTGDLFEATENPANALSVRLENASPGDVICIAEDTYEMEATVTISAVAGITLKGIGDSPDDTVLNFGGPGSGKGLVVQVDNVTIENLWVKNTGDNGVQQEETTGSVFRKLHVSWDDFCEGSGAADNCGNACGETADCDDERLVCDNEVCVGNMKLNGAYAVYPTDCHDTLVEYCQIQGASDAGVYVGKCGWGDDTTEGGVIRYNLAHENVLGIEVENSLGVVVHENTMVNNTLGMFAYLQPIAEEVPSNTDILWHHNDSYCNNHPNFAASGAAQIAPPGTGVLVLSGDGIEFCNNNIQNNDTGGVIIISSYLVCQFTGDQDCARPDYYNEYAENIYVHDNYFAGNGTSPGGEFAALYAVIGIGDEENPIEDVVWDGYINPDTDDPGICLGADSTTSYRDLSNNECQDEPSADQVAIALCANTNTTTDTTGRLCDPES